MDKNSRIVVFGASGLVGSAIVKNLVKKGYKEVIGTFHRRNLPFDAPMIKYYKIDLTNQEEVIQFFKQHKPEYVFLAAAVVGGIVANNTYRGDFIYQNLQIQNNVIHQSYINGVKKLLFLGSTCIYPKNSPQPLKEDYLLNSELEYTNEPYAIAKIAGMKMCESYNIQYGTNFLSVTPTNLYGPNDNFDFEKSHVVPALLRKIYLGKSLEEGNWEEIKRDLSINSDVNIKINHKSKQEILKILKKYGIKFDKTSKKVTIEIWGSGKPKREFMWSYDMADACVFIMENYNFKDILKIIGIKNEIRNTHINIGTGKDISIKNLADLIKKIVGFKGNFIFNIEKPDGMMVKVTDVTRLHSLGWRHKVELEKGLQILYRWYRIYLKKGKDK